MLGNPTSTFAQHLGEYERSRLPSISLQALGFVSGYLSPMSLAVSVPRMRSQYIGMMPPRGLLRFWNHD